MAIAPLAGAHLTYAQHTVLCIYGSAFASAHFAYDASHDSFACTSLINRFQRFFAAFAAAHFAYAERTALRT
jgi:hypothetical protein